MFELTALNAVACGEDCGIPLNSLAGALEFVCAALSKSVALKITRGPLKIPLHALNKALTPLMIELTALNAVACAEYCGIPLKSPGGALEFVCAALNKSVALKITRVPLKIPLLALNKAPAPLMFELTALNAVACAEDCACTAKDPTPRAEQSASSANVCMVCAEPKPPKPHPNKKTAG